jgi:hypothetical protein
MRQVVPVATTLFLLLACGPDPNARLPGETVSPSQGGSGNGGASVGSGGVVSSHGGANPFSGGGGSGGSPSSSGGASSAGGSPFGAGGVSSAGGSPFGAGGFIGTSGGATGFGGTTVSAFGGSSNGGNTGGTTTAGTCAGVVLTSYQFGTGSEPCSPNIDASCGTSGGFGTVGGICVRTADDIVGWGCSNTDGRTLKVNGTAVTCAAGSSLPAKLGSFYYFEFTGGTHDYASFYWWGTYHPVPPGGYPAWGSSGTSDVDAGP